MFVDTNVVKVLIKVNICIVALEQHLTGLVNGALVIILLDILLFLVLLIVHQFILKTKKNNFLLLDEGSTDVIDDSIGTAEKKFNINFTKAKVQLCCIDFDFALQ